MLGMADIPTALAWIGVVASAIGGVIYAVLHWNDEGEVSQSEQDAEARWRNEENEIDDEISGGNL